MSYTPIKITAALALALSVSPAAAGDRKRALPTAYSDLAACRAVADDAARLACFDKTAAALTSAVGQDDVYVVDKAEIASSRRKLFGLTLPSFSLFDHGKEATEITQIDSVVQSARQDGEGNWTVALQDGSVWRQTDRVVFGRSPRVGMPVVVKRSGLGGYTMQIQKMPSVRARRVIS